MRRLLNIHLLPWFALFLGFFALNAAAMTYYVDINSPNPTPPYTSWATASTDIQDAVNQTTNGDLVLVNPGVYQTGGEVMSGNGMTNRVAIADPITVQSVGGPAATVIEGYQMPGVTNGANAIRCVYMTNDATLIGFTITGGATLTSGNDTAVESGGGVWCQSTQSVISNCVITANGSAYGGAGVYQGTLYDCIVSNNSVLAEAYGYGGGVYESCLVNCYVISNTVNSLGPFYGYGTGGGAYDSDLTNCVVANNSVPISVIESTGGGAAQGNLINCTITGNSAWRCGGAAVNTMINCIAYYNFSYDPEPGDTNYFGGTLSYCCTTPLPSGTGNITNPPMLVSISQISSNSPCRGAGNAAVVTGVDINGNPWANPPSIGCEEPYPGSMFGNIGVNIGASGTNIAVGYPINFQANISGEVYASTWNFGDGTIASNELYAAHSWSATGAYTVILTAYNDSYPSGQSATNFVTVFQPTVFYVVATNQTPVAPYDSWTTAATNIQSAINVAIPGSLVLVSNGVYNFGSQKSPDGGTNRVAVTLPLTLQSVNGSAATVINGGSLFRCVYLTNGAVLNGFTMTNGATTNGAGIYCVSTNAFVENCLIINNNAFTGAAAWSGALSNCVIMTNSGYGTMSNVLDDCLISSNKGYGCAYATLNNCLIADNSINTLEGGAQDCTLNNCIVSNNFNYGIYFSSATACQLVGNAGTGEDVTTAAEQSELTNCLINGQNLIHTDGAFNSALVNCTVVSNSFYGAYDTTLQNCIVYYNAVNVAGGNGTDYYCCTFPLPFGPGNFTNAPLFVNPAAGNYHLQSTSPCINSGNNTYISTPTDLDGNPRIVGGTVDMGAYEYQTPTSVISYAWLQQYGLPTDGSVDFADLNGTGFSVYQDWVAGLNPTNSASVLAMLTPTATNNAAGITVTWQSVSGILYNLQRSTNLLAQPSFTTIQSNITGQSGATSYTDTTATNNVPYFYRVSVTAP